MFYVLSSLLFLRMDSDFIWDILKFPNWESVVLESGSAFESSKASGSQVKPLWVNFNWLILHLFGNALKACSLIFRHFFWRIWSIGPMDRIDNSISSLIRTLQNQGKNWLIFEVCRPYVPKSPKKMAKNKRAGLSGFHLLPLPTDTSTDDPYPLKNLNAEEKQLYLTYSIYRTSCRILVSDRVVFRPLTFRVVISFFSRRMLKCQCQ